MAQITGAEKGTGNPTGMPKVSIIVAAYNVERHIGQCLESLLAQTLEDIEIIVVDDGSADGTGALCEKFAGADRRVRLVRQGNRGVSAARNAGLGLAGGDWVTFVDGDDWAEPDMCRAALEAALRANADLVMWNHFRSRPRGESASTMFPGSDAVFSGERVGEIQRLIVDSGLIGAGMTSNATYAWCKLWRAGMVRDGRVQFDERLRWGEDQLFNLAMLERTARAAYINRCLYHYRHDPDSVSNAFREDRVGMFSAYLRALRAFLDENGKTEADFRRAYDRRVFYTLILLNSVHFSHPQNGQRLPERARKLAALMDAEPYRTSLPAADPRGLRAGRRLFLILARRRFCLPIVLAGSLKAALSAPEHRDRRRST